MRNELHIQENDQGRLSDLKRELRKKRRKSMVLSAAKNLVASVAGRTDLDNAGSIWSAMNRPAD